MKRRSVRSAFFVSEMRFSELKIDFSQVARRAVHVCATLAAVATLAACSSSDSGRFALMESLISNRAVTDYPRTQAEIDAYPYAQLGVIYDEGRPGIAVLAEYVNGNHLWVASDRFSLLTTPAGRILNLQVNGKYWRTAALDADPIASAAAGNAGQYKYQRPLEAGRLADDSESSVSTQLDCVLEATGREVLDIKEREYSTVRWRETCQWPDGQDAVLTIWVDDKQRMRRVDGFVAPSAKRIRLDMLKVPA